MAVEIIGIIACFAGVLMIAMSGPPEQNETAIESIPDASELAPESQGLFGGDANVMKIVGIVTMLFVAFNDASLNVLARTMKDLHYSLIQFWFSAIGLIFLIVFMVIQCLVQQDWPEMFSYNNEQLLYVLLTGIFSALNLTCLVIAYQNDSSATVSLLAYIALVYAFVADVTIFKLTFLALEITGAAIITFFNFFTIWYKIKYQKDDDTTESPDEKASAGEKIEKNCKDRRNS